LAFAIDSPKEKPIGKEKEGLSFSSNEGYISLCSPVILPGTR
jgi:hypothetical protein